MGRLGWIFGAAGALIAGWAAVTLLVNKDTAHLNAIGGTWESKDVLWVQESNAWRVSAHFEAKRVQLSSARANDILASLCTAMLKSRLTANKELVATNDVYRVDLNFTLPDGSHAFSRMAPLSVKEGRCIPDEFGDTFFPVFPGVLSAWYLASSGLQSREDIGNIRTLIFKLRPTGEGSVVGFPFWEACEIAMRDNLARGALAAPAGQFTFEPIADGQEVAIFAQGGKSGSMISVGTFASEVFRAKSDGCEEIS